MDMKESTMASLSDMEAPPLPDARTFPPAAHVRRLSVVRRPDGTSDHVPLLRINGRWLEQAGFSVGSPVRVSVLPNRLVIDLIETPPEKPRLPRTISPADCRY
jgi:hypothetical protein